MSWIYLIPIVAILVGGFTEWLKFKEKQLRLGDTTESLTGNIGSIVDRLDEALDANTRLQDRVKNLEVIVTTQMWDDIIDQPKIVDRGNQTRLELPEDEASTEEKTRQIARQIRH